ncbi:MAG: hypothetical protein QOF19_1941 [Alphaproteobacteria bacterium]|jgi:hypothetical protein|nr:hypothetical protein [Alphaproteobacteria bacterium]
MWLNKDDQQKAKQLFQILLERKQKEFCKKLDILPTTLSSALGGHRPIPDDTWNQVLDGLGQELNGPREPALDSAVAATAQALLEDLSISAGRQPARSRPLPGGPLPIGASVYVKRDCDEKIIGALSGGNSVVAVTGGPQSGRSSLLFRVAQWAESSGFSVTLVDFDDFILRLKQKDLSREELLIEIGEAAGFEIPERQNRQKIHAGFEQGITERSTRTMLIYDSVDEAAMEGLSTIWSALLLLMNLQTYFAYKAPHKFAAVTVFGAEAWNAMAGTGFDAASHEIKVSNFTQPEIALLAKAATDEAPDQKTINKAYSLFGGQSYLTHLFFEDLRQEKSAEKIIHAARSLQGHYGSHAERVVRRLEKVNSQDLYRLDFVTVCQELAGPRKDWREVLVLGKWLKQLGIAVDDGPICEVYRLAFQRKANPEKGSI